MAKRKRDIQLKVRVTPEERAMSEAKMAQLGTTNRGASLFPPFILYCENRIQE